LSLLYRNPDTGGELHQAGVKEIPHILRNNNISLLILAAREYQPKNNFGVDVMYAPMKDSSKLAGKALRDTIKAASIASRHAVFRILNGERVLSTCWAGLNRSGLISGLALKRLVKHSPETIVNVIRKRRSPRALFNLLFVDIILSPCT